jgi:hypothetical protein
MNEYIVWGHYNFIIIIIIEYHIWSNLSNWTVFGPGLFVSVVFRVRRATWAVLLVDEGCPEMLKFSLIFINHSMYFALYTF